MKTILIIIFSFFVYYISCGNVLFISPLPSPSHHLWNKIISMELIGKGHNITMLSHNTEKKPISNFTVITIPGMYETMREVFKMEEAAEQSTFATILQMYDFSKFICEYDFKNEGLDTLLNYPKDFKFDLIIFDLTICQCYYPLVERFNNPPLIGVTAFLLPPSLSNTFGNHLHPSYIPFYGSQFTSNMTLYQRIVNFFYTYLELFAREYLTASDEMRLAKERFGENIRPFEEVERSISLLLSNIDPVLNYPLALPPNIIPVGGLHARPGKPLPTDLETLMNKAKDGVILFSLGTNVKSSDLKPEVKKTLIQAFAKLPQTIIWKYETEDLEGLPKNVIIKKWLPQNDILGHPKTKLFLTHGGALSTQESMFHGVPVIGIPFFADQYLNIRQMKNRGIAESVDLQTNPTANEVYEKIHKVLNSNSYKNKVKKISELYRDQPQTPLERAIFWIEYVMRHGTAEHLVLPARDMPGYQTANLDVLAVFVLALILIYLLVKTVVVSIVRCMCARESKKDKKVKLS